MLYRAIVDIQKVMKSNHEQCANELTELREHISTLLAPFACVADLVKEYMSNNYIDDKISAHVHAGLIASYDFLKVQVSTIMFDCNLG